MFGVWINGIFWSDPLNITVLWDYSLGCNGKYKTQLNHNTYRHQTKFVVIHLYSSLFRDVQYVHTDLITLKLTCNQLHTAQTAASRYRDRLSHCKYDLFWNVGLSLKRQTNQSQKRGGKLAGNRPVDYLPSSCLVFKLWFL